MGMTECLLAEAAVNARVYAERSCRVLAQRPVPSLREGSAVLALRVNSGIPLPPEL